MSSRTDDPDLRMRLGRDELVVQQRYETLSILNDILLGSTFLVGSFLFLSDRTATAGTWLFILGSLLMLVRPIIRLARRVHLGRTGGHGRDDRSMDF